MVKVYTWKESDNVALVASTASDIWQMQADYFDYRTLERISQSHGLTLVALVPLKKSWLCATISNGETTDLIESHSWTALIPEFVSTCTTLGIANQLFEKITSAWIYDMLVEGRT